MLHAFKAILGLKSYIEGVFFLFLALLFGCTGLFLMFNSDELANVLVGAMLMILSAVSCTLLIRRLRIGPEKVVAHLEDYECPHCKKIIRVHGDAVELAKQTCTQCGAQFDTTQS